ncbi:MAG: hypothetical protein J0L84_01910 [Verrucomicrobia bacterium]|nr:hypothetical protein [Verrucomicrobiota bacterium]
MPLSPTVPLNRLRKCLDSAIGWFELGMPGEALRELESLPEADRARLETLELQAVLLQQQQRWDDAAATYAALCRQEGACVDRFIAWGCCLYELNRIPECREALLAAPESAHQHGLWNYHLACYEALLGRTDEARRLIRHSLEIEPRLRAMALRNSNLAPLIAG